jgi:hypothetical protein
MNTSLRRTLLSLALLAAHTGAGAANADIEDPELKACMERSLPQKAMTQSLTFSVFEGDEAIDSTSADLLWKRGEDGLSKVIVRVTAPPPRAGIAVLALEKAKGDPEFNVYMPESRKSRRVAGRTIDASMFGTDFSYEDFSHFQGMTTEGSLKRLDNEQVDGVENLVVEVLPGSEGTKYSRIVTWVEKERCALTRMSFFAKNGTPLKDLEVPRDALKQMGERWVPHKIVLQDHKRGRRTELVVNEIALDPELSENTFSVTRFGAGN